MALAVGDRDFIQTMALRAAQQAIKNLPANQRREHGDVFRCIEQACQTQHGIEHRTVDLLDIQTPPGRPRRHAHRAGVGD
ncbi:hypothetical protein D3C81_1729470 [compost metagenome]